VIPNKFDKKANEILQILQESPAAAAVAIPALTQVAPWITGLFSVLVGTMVGVGGGAWAPPLPTPTETDVKPEVDKNKPKTYPPLVPPIPSTNAPDVVGGSTPGVSPAPDVVGGTPEISAPVPAGVKTPDVAQPVPADQAVPVDQSITNTAQNVEVKPAEVAATQAAVQTKQGSQAPVVVPPPKLNYTPTGSFSFKRPEEGFPNYQSLTPYAMGQSYTDNSNLSPNQVWKQVMKGKQPIEELPADMQSPEEVAQRFKKWKADQTKRKYEGPGAFGGLVGDPHLD